MSKPMTNYNKRLDEIERVIRSVLTPNSYIVPQEGIRLTKAILDWHSKQIEETMAKFHLKRGVEYDVKASDSVIVITPSIKPKDSDQ